MTQAKIPFVNQQASGSHELGGASPAAINIVVDDAGVVHRRPGVTAYSGAPSGGVIDANGISGLHLTTGGTLYAVGAAGAERPIYKVTSAGGTALGGGVPPFGLRGTLRPVFAETELLLAISGGDLMQKIVLATSDSSRLGGSPPISSHVIANASRLLANDLVTSPTNVRFSDVASGNVSYAGHEVWTLGVGTAGFFSKEAKPDPVVALGESSSQVFVFGSETTQIYQPDPTLTYGLVGALEVGCGSPYSVVRADETFFWLDHLHRFVQSDGRGMTVISDPIQKTLDEIATIDDVFGYRVTDGYIEALVWSFPTDQRTFVFQKGSGWAEWLSYSSTTNNFTNFEVKAHTQRGGSPHIVAVEGGFIGRLSLDETSDYLGGNIVARVRTGYLNHDTDAFKHCKNVRVSLARGLSSATPGPQGFLRWRDRPGAWTGQIPIDFGSSGDTEIVLPFYGLGTYRRRQWEFEFSSTESFALVGVTEEFDVLEV